jgi:outer membrane protein assembly factor BamB
MRLRKAFIFTADAVLAFYLITIILSVLLLLSYSPRLYTEQFQTVARDTLVALSSIRLRDVQGNPQYNYTSKLLYIKDNSVAVWPMFERTVDHNSSLMSVYPTSNSTWMTYLIGPNTATQVRSSPVLYYGKIIMESAYGTYAFDDNTGQQLWKLPIRAYSTPTVYKGHIFLGSLNSTLFSLDERGDIVWNATFNGNVISSPLVHNGKVFVGVTNGSFKAFDADSGADAWGNYSFSANGNITSSPAVYNRNIIISASNYTASYLYSIDEDTGAVLWNYTSIMPRPIDLPVDPSPLVVKEIVYFSNEAGVYAINATNGFELWRYVSATVRFTSSPVFDNGMLYIGCNNTVTSPPLSQICVIDTTSASSSTPSIDQIPVGSPIYASPVVMGDSILIATYDGTITLANKSALRIFSALQPLWSYKVVDSNGVSQPIYSSPAVVNGRVYIGANDGKLYSIAAFWLINKTDCAQAIAKEFLDSAVPQNYGFELVIKSAEGTGFQCTRGGLSPCYYCNGTLSSEWDSIYTNDCNQMKYQRFLIRDNRYISGVLQKGSTIYYALNPIEVEIRIWN